MADVDYYQHASLGFDEEGLPMWGDEHCSSCHAYGWLVDTEEDDYFKMTKLGGCHCCLPENDLDWDRLQERLHFVAELMVKSDGSLGDIEDDHDLH